MTKPRLFKFFVFLAPVSDYFLMLWYNKRLFLYEWALPVGLAFLSIEKDPSALIKTFSLGFIIGLLATMMAFSITILGLILAFSSSITVELKQKQTDVVLSDKNLSLYQLMFTNTSYSIVVEGVLVIVTLFFMVRSSWVSWISVSAILLFTAQVILINLRTITNIYLVYIRPELVDKVN